MCVSIIGFFFFQAEDGIRDLVRSRGLGDVYKRQTTMYATHEPPLKVQDGHHHGGQGGPGGHDNEYDSVSYTHLTLPTSDLV